MMKKLACMGMALAMSVSILGGSALAVAPTTLEIGTGESTGMIMPRAALFPNGPISGNNSAQTTKFTATSSNGNYIRFWYQNNASASARVYLIRTDSGKEVIVGTIEVSGNGGQKADVYYNSTASSGTYYILIEASDGGSISGNVSAAQYQVNPQ